MEINRKADVAAVPPQRKAPASGDFERFRVTADRLRMAPDGEVEAPAGAPHWIVMCLSHHKAPHEFRPRWFFRHQTEDLAEAQATRLAGRFVGKRFSVYGAGLSIKMDAPEGQS